MTSAVAETRFAPRWLHGWALLTVAATVVLLALGAVVTTYRVGMADPVWPTVPWHLALIDWTEPNPGFVIEHSHRLAGYVVGCCVIVLTIGLLYTARRSWLKWLGVAALAGVIGQGVLGGSRVLLHARFGTDLSIVHGCFAQIVFSLFVSLAVVTSARFAVNTSANPLAGTVTPPRLRFGALALTILIYFQVIWGAVLRHTNAALAQRMHFLTAFAVVGVAVWFAHAAATDSSTRRLFRRTLIVLGVFLSLQILLGVESWLGKYVGVLLPEAHNPTPRQAAIRVAHVLTGSFIFATSVVLTVLAYRSSSECSGVADSLRESEPNGGTTTPQNPAITTFVQQLEGSA